MDGNIISLIALGKQWQIDKEGAGYCEYKDHVST
jgi:hypothetical protein